MTKLTCVDKNGKYFPWVYRAYREASTTLEYEEPFTAFERTYNGRFVYTWDGTPKEFLFNNDDDATLFMLRFF